MNRAPKINPVVLQIAIVIAIHLFAFHASAAEVIHVGTAFRGEPTSDGFPEFLNASVTNSTTRAWNLGGDPSATDVSINGVSLDGPDGGGYDNGLTIGGAPTALPDTAFNTLFVGDPDFLDKRNVANTGLYVVGGTWSADITATPGQAYTVEVLSNPAAGQTRSLDVTVDGVLFADNLFVPASNPTPYEISVVYRFDVVAGLDGVIDIDFAPGADGTFTDPYVTGLAITAIVPAPAALPAGLALLGLTTARRRRQR